MKPEFRVAKFKMKYVMKLVPIYSVLNDQITTEGQQGPFDLKITFKGLLVTKEE